MKSYIFHLEVLREAHFKIAMDTKDQKKKDYYLGLIQGLNLAMEAVSEHSKISETAQSATDEAMNQLANLGLVPKELNGK